MATYDLEEQEQLSELKLFWQQNGKLITGLLMGVLVALAGWQGWNWYSQSKANAANEVFARVQEGAMGRDANKVKAAAGELVEKYPQTEQAALAALLSAKFSLAAKDVPSAKAQLTFVAERASDMGLRDLATLRLAGILLDEKAYDEALKRLSREPSAEFAPRTLDLKGDVLAAAGKTAEAVAAWKDAIAKIDALHKLPGTDAKRHATLHDVVEAKIETAGQGK